MTGLAALIEVSYPTLLICGDNLGGERQAYALPTGAGILDKYAGLALVPHYLIITHGVLNRSIEVLTVYQEVVTCSNVITVIVLNDHVSVQALEIQVRYRQYVEVVIIYGVAARLSLGVLEVVRLLEVGLNYALGI